MAEVPVESRNKYGNMEWDDVDELAAGLDGRPFNPKSVLQSSSSSSVGSESDEVDETFFQLTRDTARKYGTL